MGHLVRVMKKARRRRFAFLLFQMNQYSPAQAALVGFPAVELRHMIQKNNATIQIIPVEGNSLFTLPLSSRWLILTKRSLRPQTP
jgi:hypothetical protein